MGKELSRKNRSNVLAMLHATMGEAPLLNSEDREAYERGLWLLIESFCPRNYFEMSLIWQLAMWTWDIRRYGMFRSQAIERRVADPVEPVEPLANALEAFRRRIQKPGSPIQPAPQEKKETKIKVQPDYCDAFERSIEPIRRIDDLMDKAIARRNDVLNQLDHCRSGLSRLMLTASDELIQAEDHVMRNVSLPKLSTKRIQASTARKEEES